MQHTAFSCPHCRARLRIQDRSHVGRAIDCPDCDQPIQLVSDSLGRITALPRENTPPVQVAPQANDWLKKKRSPMLVAWTSVSLAAAVVLWIVLRDDNIEPPELPPPPAVAHDPTEPNEPIEPVLADAPSADEEPILPVLAGDQAANEQAPPSLLPPPDPEDERPIDVPVASDIPMLDVARQLEQSILEFSQERPVPARRLLQMVAEMSAVPVDLGEVDVDPWQELLDKEISLVFKNKDVASILAAILELTELEMDIRDGVIHILPPGQPTSIEAP